MPKLDLDEVKVHRLEVLTIPFLYDKVEDKRVFISLQDVPPLIKEVERLRAKLSELGVTDD